MAAKGQVLYDDSENQTNYVLNFNNGSQVGDQIFLANYLTYPYLTSFSLEYYSPDSTFNGSVQMDVSFYLNNGTLFNGYHSPGGLFYDTGYFSIQTPQQAEGQHSAVLSFNTADLYSAGLAATPMSTSFQMPSNFTVVVTFAGLAGPDSVGLNDFEPPTVGTNYGDYWLYSGSSWELLTNSTPIGFGMVFNAQAQPTPEPTTLCLAAVGGALLAGFARRRRRQ